MADSPSGQSLEEQVRALEEYGEYLKALLRTIPDMVWLKDPDGRYLFCNSKFESMYGVEETQLLGKTDYDFADRETADAYRRGDIQAATEGKPLQWEEDVLFRSDGHVETLEVIKTPIQKPDGTLLGVLGIGRDITKRKRLEVERLATLRFFENMDKVNRVMQAGVDMERTLSDILDAVLPIFGCDRISLVCPCDPEAPSWTLMMERTTPEYPHHLPPGATVAMSPLGRSIFRALLDSDVPVEIIPGEDPADETWTTSGMKSLVSKAIYPKVGPPWAFSMQQCSHERRWSAAERDLFHEISRRVSDGLTSLLIYRDLKNSREILARIIENIPNPTFLIDAETRKYVKVNRAAAQFLGYSAEEIAGKGYDDIFPKGQADRLTAMDSQALDGGELIDIPAETIRTQFGKESIVHTKKIPIPDETGKPKYLLGISEDITGRTRLEEQLRQSQKLESVGRLAGGIAHDFNNMLGVIIGHAELALETNAPGDPVIEHLREIRKAANRSADLTRQLLAFARRQIAVPRKLDLNRTIEGMIEMLRSLTGERIDLVWKPGSGIWPVRMDPSQVDQILASLCENARDAIEDIGRVTVETGNSSFTEASCAANPEFLPGDFVMLAVGDTGSGMDKETADRIFEPFFSTKGVGKGTGLGLATVYGIVKQNDGFINVHSETGKGTTFRIYFPRRKEEAESSGEGTTEAPVSSRKETVLLVEDVPEILAMATLMLERFGYKVLSVSSPEEAIKVARELKEKIHLLISDVIMPGMNGRQLAQAVSSIHPGIKSLFMSGYPEDAIAHHGVLDPGVHFLQKPFSMHSFSVKVREALDDGK